MSQNKKIRRDYIERVLRIIGATYVSYLIFGIIYVLYNYIIVGTQDWADEAGGYLFMFFFMNIYFLFSCLVAVPVLYILHAIVYYFIKENNIRYLILALPFFVLIILSISSDGYEILPFVLALFLPPGFFIVYFNRKMDKNISDEEIFQEDENLLDDMME